MTVRLANAQTKIFISISFDVTEAPWMGVAPLLPQA
jgi:hypothetical protein